MTAASSGSELSRIRARTARYRLAVLFGLGFCMCSGLLLDLSTGPAQLGIGSLLSGIFWPESLDAGTYVIIWQVRLPDSLIAIVIGMALGLAGAETQTILNNPLASPYTLGISAAATLGAATAIVGQPVLAGIPAAAALPAFAFLFALAAAALVLGLASAQGGGTSTVILYGIALVFLCNALTGALQYLATSEAVQQIVFWTIGNLTKAGWAELAIVTAVVVLMVPFSFHDVWKLTALRGGVVQARSAGLDVSRIRLLVMLRVCLLAAVSVCFVGAIGFIGLVGPHIARLLLGEDHRYLIPGACLTGAALLSFASFLSKAVLPGAIVPVGIVTAIIGVPVFLILIASRSERTSWS
ncbi:MAG: iron ABC transporter permease [Pseudomonadota bacterium]